jgi:transposase
MLQIHSVPEIPDETARIARAAFPKGSLAIKLRDELGVIYTDEQFSDLFPEWGQPAESPAPTQDVEVDYLDGTGLKSARISPFAALAT